MGHEKIEEKNILPYLKKLCHNIIDAVEKEPDGNPVDPDTARRLVNSMDPYVANSIETGVDCAITALSHLVDKSQQFLKNDSKKSLTEQILALSSKIETNPDTIYNTSTRPKF